MLLLFQQHRLLTTKRLYIENSQLETNILSEETYPTTKDSALEVRRYTVSNQMSVRVPQKNLSEFLNSLNDEIQFLDHRNITAEDISLEIYKSRLEEERSKSTAGKLNQLSNEKGEIYETKNIKRHLRNCKCKP